MAFTRVNPSGWSGAPGTSSDEFTSTQANQLDIDHANALDKTTAGDTLAGTVLMTSSAAIVASNANNIQVTGSGGITVSYGTGSIVIESPASMVVHNGASVLVEGSGGIDVTGVYGIQSNVTAGISTGTTGGIQSGTPGGFQLAGGTNDWPAFSANRTRTLWVPGDGINGVTQNPTATIANAAVAQFEGIGSPCCGGFTTTEVSTASSTNAFAYYLPMRQLHNGATLATATLYLQGSATHTALPALLPRFGIFRSTLGGGGAVPLYNTNDGFVADTTSTVGGYTSTHAVMYTANENNVIDTSQYAYYVVIIDECGTANAEPGNYFGGIQIGYSAIANMAFP